LTRAGKAVELKSKAFDILKYLVINHGNTISKDELLLNIWPGQFVEENNLTVQISAIRKAIGDPAGKSRYILTVPGRGYRFTGEVESVEIVAKDAFEDTPSDKNMSEDESGGQILPRPDLTKSDSKWRRALFAVALVSTALVLVAVGVAAVWEYTALSTESKIADFKVSRITSTGKVTNAVITPDGRFIVFAQKEAGGESLNLQDLISRGTRIILPAREMRYVGLAVSRDGDEIYATTFSANTADPQIWRVPIVGGVVREIDGITTGSAVTFSPDGKQIAFTESHSSINESQLLTAKADGTEKRVLKSGKDGVRSFPNFNSNPVAWSPDGREIACVAEEKKDGVKAGILLIDPNDSSERFISELRWDHIENITWIDNDNLAFVAYRTEPWIGQIWTVSRSTGRASQISNDANSYSWISNEVGNLIAVQQFSVSRISVADFDNAGKNVQPTELFSESGLIEYVDFAPDGSINFSSSASGRREIWTMSADGSDRKQLTRDASVSFGMAVSPIDGSIVFCAEEKGRHALQLVDREGKNIRRLTDGVEDVFPSFSSDGKRVVFQKGIRNQLVSIWSVDISTGKQTQIRSAHSTHPVYSPDNRFVAAYMMDSEADDHWKIEVFSAETGQSVRKLDFDKPVFSRRMRWYPDGRSIGQVAEENGNTDLLMIPIDGSGNRLIKGFGKGSVNWFDFSDNGRKIVISGLDQTTDVVNFVR
jgi:Tol biopolymer transport system component/DNA-binding winged helix-turn-helix (wHTH) protein